MADILKLKAIGRFVTVHIGLRTCCADRRLNWASEQKSHRRRRFSWIFACCCELVYSNYMHQEILFYSLSLYYLFLLFHKLVQYRLAVLLNIYIIYL